MRWVWSTTSWPLLGLMAELEADFMVVGGVALEALGVPRSTLDIDVQVQLPERPGTSSSYFHGWFIAERSTDAVFDQDVLILEGRRTGVPVEMFLTGPWFTEQALDRRQPVTSGLLDQEIPVPSPEDFVLLKEMYRTSPTRGEAKATQDRLDIEGVVEAHRDDLELTYLEETGSQLGVWSSLEALVR